MSPHETPNRTGDGIMALGVDPSISHVSMPRKPGRKTSPKAASRCSTCHDQFILPPSVEHITRLCPDVSPDSNLDRTIPRCRRCDRHDASLREARVPFESTVRGTPVVDFLRHLIETKLGDLDEAQADISQAEIRKLLIKLNAELGRAEARTLVAIRRAWEPCWAVWGRPAHQEYLAEVDQRFLNRL